MARRLFDYDPETGVSQYHEYDELTDTTLIHTHQDVSPFLEENKRAANEASGPLGDGVRVASIPVGVQLKWLTEHGIDLFNRDHWPGVRRLLNSNEYRYLKVRHIII